MANPLNASPKDVVKHLLNDDYIQVPRDLAKCLGLDEAAIVKQINSWCEFNRKNKSAQHFKEGYYWTFNTYKEWIDEFPWLGYRTLQRKFKKLEELGVIVASKHRARQNDQTKWYRVDAERLYEVFRESLDRQNVQNLDSVDSAKMAHCESDKLAYSRGCQNGTFHDAKMADSTMCQNGMISFNKRTTNEAGAVENSNTPSASGGCFKAPPTADEAIKKE